MSEIDREYFESQLKARRISMRSLATQLGIAHSQLSLTFSGKRRMQLDEAVRIAEIIGVPLHLVAERAGCGESRRGIDIIGFLGGNGEIEPFSPTAKQIQVKSSDELPADVIAFQARTAGTPLAWLDGTNFFAMWADQVEPEARGRLCFAKIHQGPMVMAQLSRGYEEDTYNLTGPYEAESVKLEYAAPILLSRH